MIKDHDHCSCWSPEHPCCFCGQTNMDKGSCNGSGERWRGKKRRGK